MRRDFDHIAFSNRCVLTMAGNAAVTTTCQGVVSAAPNQAATTADAAARTDTLEVIVLQKTPGSTARWRGLGVLVGVAIAGIAIFALTHALKNVNYDEVLAVVRRTHSGLIALALLLVATSYGSLTLYDLLALRTIKRTEVPYRIAALASFTSYPIAHGLGAVALISPVIRYESIRATDLARSMWRISAFSPG
jgi:hypothetical protein